MPHHTWRPVLGVFVTPFSSTNYQWCLLHQYWNTAEMQKWWLKWTPGRRGVKRKKKPYWSSMNRSFSEQKSKLLPRASVHWATEWLHRLRQGEGWGGEYVLKNQMFLTLQRNGENSHTIRPSKFHLFQQQYSCYEMQGTEDQFWKSI